MASDCCNSGRRCQAWRVAWEISRQKKKTIKCCSFRGKRELKIHKVKHSSPMKFCLPVFTLSNGMIFVQTINAYLFLSWLAWEDGAHGTMGNISNVVGEGDTWVAKTCEDMNGNWQNFTPLKPLGGFLPRRTRSRLWWVKLCEFSRIMALDWRMLWHPVTGSTPRSITTYRQI